jgi:Fe-S oxidoreductase
MRNGDGKVDAVLQPFQEGAFNRQMILSLAGCAHCGLCTDSCHYYLATGDPKMTPASKADEVRRFYGYYQDWLGRMMPWWVGGRTLKKESELEKIKDVVFGSCSMCRRCLMHCPLGIDVASIMRMMRGRLARQGIAPEGIRTVCRDQRETGNQMGVSRQDYLETLEWIREEVAAELDDPTVRIPVDQEGSDFVYVINPREIKYSPLSFMAAVKIFHVVRADWTMPSTGWDATNFGLFSGQDDLGAHMGRLAYDQAIKLKVRRIVVSECGHGFRSLRWEAPNWAGSDLSFTIESLLEVMVQYVREGRMVLDSTRNPEPVTYHDPCNLARSSGITEEPRFLLNKACSDFREMYPNRADSFCCTGGGGAMAMAEYSQRRLEAARIKAEQIRATGARQVATACHNCVDGLTDLIKHYQIPIHCVRSVCEFVADALVDKRRPNRREDC